MSLITASNLQVYNPQVRSSYIERIAKAINGFIQKANGAFIVEDATVPGDFIQTSWWKTPSGLVTRRIATGTGSDAAVTPVTVQQGENAEVRLSRKIGPVAITDDALRKLGVGADEFGMWVGEMAADGVLEKEITDGLLATVGALNRAPYRVDKSTATNPKLTRQALAEALALMGDRAGDIVCWVMHSKPFFDLLAADLDPDTSSDTLMTGVAVYGASPATLGRPAVVIDDSALVLDETEDKYYSLGLTTDAIHLTADTQLSDLLIERTGGSENIINRIQGERDWFLRLKGFTWNMQAGGTNPSDAALATATNWTASSTNAKDRAGVLVKSK